jgi:hypothetical protein
MTRAAVVALIAVVVAGGCSEQMLPGQSTPRNDAGASTPAPSMPQPGRLRPLFYFNGGQRLAQTGSYHDSALDLDCSFSPASDGTGRCQPGTDEETRFLDPVCTMPVSRTPPGSGRPWSGVAVHLPCGRLAVETYRRGSGEPQVVTAPHDGPSFEVTNGACQRVHSPLRTIFLRGDEIPPSELAELRMGER